MVMTRELEEIQVNYCIVDEETKFGLPRMTLITDRSLETLCMNYYKRFGFLYV